MNIESTVNHLYKISNNLNIPNQVGAILKSYYLTTSRIISIAEYKLPQKQFGVEKTCQYCSLPWKNGFYEAKVKSLKKRKKSIRRKLRKTIEKCKSANAVKKAKKSLNCNILNVKCLMCNKINNIYLKKPQKKLINQNKVQVELTINEPNVKFKDSPKLHEINEIKQSVYADLKKVVTSTPMPEKVKAKPRSNKKKDKFAGLCKIACTAASKQRELNSSAEKHEERLKLFLRPAS